MYCRVVTARLKSESVSEQAKMTQEELLPILRNQKGFVDAITLRGTNGTDVMAISFWENKESAEAYQRSAYSEVMKKVEKFIEGAPQVKTYEITNSTIRHLAAARAA